MMRRLLILTVCLLVAGSAVYAGDKDSFFDRTKFKGDLRLRYEGFDQDGKFDDGKRNRFRFRFRVGFTTKINDMIKVGLELRSGDSNDPVSDNQSLDGGFSKKDISIAQAFGDFALTDDFSVIAGKFAPKKLWKVSDMAWDDDVVVEGAMGRYSRGNVKANVFAFALEESSSGDDAYLFGGQIAPHFKRGNNSFSFGVGYETYSEPDVMAGLTLGGKLKGNKVSNYLDGNDMLISDFDIASVFVEWKNKGNKRWPVKFTAHYYQNLGAEGIGEDDDTAYFARIQIGDYKKPGEMAFRFSKYYSEPDALFYAFTQSDTTRSSNLDGYRFDWRVGLGSKGYVNVTWYNTDVAVGVAEKMNRWQVDYILKF